MDRWTSFWAYHAARGRSAGRQLEVEMGQKKTVHDRRIVDSGNMLDCARVDVRNSGHIRHRRRFSQSIRVLHAKRSSDCLAQKRSCTIALAVLSIYAVDFAINAGKCHRSECLVRLYSYLSSTIVLSKPNRRYLADTQTATWVCLG